jgi:FixJ family two-component response regulator
LRQALGDTQPGGAGRNVLALDPVFAPAACAGARERRVNRSRQLIAVVDGDASVRESLLDFLDALGYAVCTFASAEALLSSSDVPDVRCLVVDLALPGKSGLELKQDLVARGHEIPTVFMTPHANDVLRRQVADGPSVACLFKPFDEASLLEALRAALRRRRS